MTRLKFKNDWTYAQADKKAFEMWLQGQINAEQAIRRLKLNNEWEEEITVEEFHKLAFDLGYRKYGKGGNVHE